MLVREALADTRRRLLAAGLAEGEAWMQARILTAAHCGAALRELPFRLEQTLDAAALAADLARLLAGEPIQYVLGETEFMGLRFRCSPAALIPRLDSEPLVARALALFRAADAPYIADTCTGSGAYALALAHYLPQSRVAACDISANALALAAENAALLDVAGRVELLQGDLLAPLAGRGPVFDLITANPPYIATAALDALAPQLKHEPRLALDGGADGLCLYARLAGQAAGLLRPGGWLLLEHGDDQAAAVLRIARAAGFTACEQLQDYAHRPRGLLARLGS